MATAGAHRIGFHAERQRPSGGLDRTRRDGGVLAADLAAGVLRRRPQAGGWRHAGRRRCSAPCRARGRRLPRLAGREAGAEARNGGPVMENEKPALTRDAPQFYIIDTRSIGNCALWWRPNREGY